MGGPVKLEKALREDARFHRQELIEWWDQSRLARARVLVIGAGALGNEILKNLALVGVGAAFVVDMDVIENSNLARSVLFRAEDIGQAKAPVAAARAKAIYPEMRVQPFVGNAVYDLGLGVFRWADITICGLDNREARVAVNRNCLRMGRPWVDGAIERLDGVVRTFLPGPDACYECTMNEIDWQMLEARRSCALLTRDEMLDGHTPTTATTASVVAGLQCQEALKYLHGIEVRGGTGLVMNGQAGEIHAVTYSRKPDCPEHEPPDEVVELDLRSDSVTMGGLLDRARSDLGPDATLELSREILHELECPRCGRTESVFLSLGKVTEKEGMCAACATMRIPRLLHGMSGGEGFAERSPLEIGLPPFDVVTARNGPRSLGYLMAGDAAAVLGEAADANRKD